MASIIGTNLIGLVIVLGFLVFVHEAGHFLVAKLFRVRVLVFSFGFGKRLFGFRKGDTDYRVSLIPLGGYVRMAGDAADEGGASFEATAAGQQATGAPDEFLSKPKWQRFLILLAGPAMNVIVAIAFYAGLTMIGLKQPIMPPIVGEVFPGKPAAHAGLQVGDLIVRVNGETIEDFEDLRLVVSMHANTPLVVEYIRNGVTRKTMMTPQRDQSDYGPVGRAGIAQWLNPIVGGFDSDSPAEKAGLRAGDRIVAANGTPIIQLQDLVRVADKAHGAAMTLDITRRGTPMRITIPAVPYNPDDIIRGILPQYRIQRLSLGEALKASVKENTKMLRYAFISLSRLFRPEGSIKELSGLPTIARISGEMFRRGWVALISLMAMISLQLGVMNLLPIPVLDGGHIFILLIEGVARRDLSIRVKERIQQLGFVFLVMLLLVVNFNDVLTSVMRKG